MKLSAGMLVAFCEEVITYSGPVKIHKNSRAKTFPLPFLMLLWIMDCSNLLLLFFPFWFYLNFKLRGLNYFHRSKSP